ncbi:MAG TPA: trehalose-6-phosphate synthase [Streptosporangiaceae bacterium]|nr:trehalose-6-phosphate synthase [Streptosporangiaceae bacterium]
MGAAAAGGPVLVASNRGPLSFSRGPDGRLTARRGGGGVVSGLLAAASQADLLWVCAALSDADRDAARAAPGGRLPLDDAGSARSAALMLDIPAATFAAAYNGIANSTLWFIHHLLYNLPRQPGFGVSFWNQWSAYTDYNRAFATALARAAGDGGQPRALVQDYHLALVPRMLAELRPGIRISHFSHTPWAPPDYYRVLPDRVAREILAGILGADHAGFLSQRWADAFADCCAAVLGAEVDRSGQRVTYDGHVTTLGVHALGVDAGELRQRAAQPDVEDRVADLTELAGGRQLIVRIDRTELSKNIVRGLAAYRELLVSRPQWRGRVMHLAFAYPSRYDLPEYRAYTAAVQQEAEQITAEFGTPDWTPLVVRVDDDYARSLAAYRVADVVLVNPVRDGMNLVAKEAPIVSDRGCALVLSREAGAAAELGEAALLVNPFDVTGTAAALHEALSMPPAERADRSARLAAAGAAVPPQRWLAGQLAALEG